MKYLVRGFITIIPIFFSLYAVVFVLTKIESFLKDFIPPILPFADHWPGFYLFLALGFTYTIGFLMSYSLAQKGQKLIEKTLLNTPIVGNIYSTLKDLLILISQSSRQLGQPVLVKMSTGDTPYVFGFVTNENWSETYHPQSCEIISVFVPFSLALGGITIFVHKNQITPLNISRQKALSNALAAWIPSQTSVDENPSSQPVSRKISSQREPDPL